MNLSFGFSKDIGFLNGTLFLFSPFFLHLPQAGRLTKIKMPWHKPRHLNIKVYLINLPKYCLFRQASA